MMRALLQRAQQCLAAAHHSMASTGASWTAAASLQPAAANAVAVGAAVVAGRSPALQARHLTVTRELVNKLLKTPEISSLLQEGNVDFRDCFERRELVDKLVQHQHALPPAVRQHLAQMLSARSTGGGASGPAPSGAGGAASAAGAPGQEQAQGQGAEQPRDPASAMTPRAAAEAAAAGVPPPMPETVNGLFADERQIVMLYQRCRPSVVHIACTGSGKQGALGGVLLDPEQVPRNFGSGFVWDKQGHVVTNYHVIRGASTAQVTLSNGQKYLAKLKGAEPDKDLAVLKIDAPAADLVPVDVAVSSRLVVGQKVYAIGNPFGLDHTLTAGIVSGLGRQMQSITGHTIRDVVQTDASINPGNSGGPLLDSQGRLIGVNTAATSHPQTTAGFGFAIPSDTVRRIVNQLIRYERVVRPGLGVMCMHDMHSRQLLNGAEGVVIEAPVPGSGAAQAGLRGVMRDEYGNIALGDVIVAVGGQKVAGVEELVSYVEQFNLGDQVPITIHRYQMRSPRDRSKAPAFTTVELSVPLLHEAKSF